MDLLPEVIYLHGLGSSPNSEKARLVRSHLQSLGYRTHTPSLSVPSLAKLSVDAATGVVQECVNGVVSPGGYILIGSSFGGFLALHTLARLGQVYARQVRGVVLLAPALYPWHPTYGMVTPAMEEVWDKEGVFPVQESESGKIVGVHVEFIRQLKLLDVDRVHTECPILVIHGQHDEVVPIEQSFHFGSTRPNVTVIPVPDTHQLLAHPVMLTSRVGYFVQECGKKASTGFA